MTRPAKRPTKALPAMTVYLYVETLRDGSHRVAIGVEDAGRSGHGYRICGPKYDGRVPSNEGRYVVDARAAREIRSYLKHVPATPRRRSR